MRSVIGSVGEFDDVTTAVQLHYNNLKGERVKNVFRS